VGTDDLFHKRRAKRQVDLRRREPVREPYKKVLIVTEGSKTEPLYFQELTDHYKLNSANVCVTGDCGSDPVSVVEFGIQQYHKEKKKGDPFDCVYCVIDRDTHPNYNEALSRLGDAKPKGVFKGVPSVPCFEYWLLLHFTYTTAPFLTVKRTSACAAVIKELQQHWPAYNKAASDTFMQLLDKLDTAKKYAVLALKAAEQTGTDNPTTRVHELVTNLQNIKSLAS